MTDGTTVTPLDTENAPGTEAQPQDQSPDYLASLRLIWPYLTGQRIKLAMAITLATAAVALELIPVYIIYRFVRDVVNNSLVRADFMMDIVIAVGATITGYVLFALAMMMSHLVAFEGIYRLRLKISRHLACLPLGYFANRKSGDAKKLIVDDTEKLELVVAHGMPEGISAAATWISISIWLFVVDWRMALACIFAAPASLILLIMGMKATGRFAVLYQAAGQRMNGSMVEYITGMPVVKVFNRMGDSFREVSDSVNTYAEIEKKSAAAHLPLSGTFFSMVLSNIVFIVPVGAYLIASGRLDLATLVFFIILGANYSRPLLKLFNLFHELAHIGMGSTLVADVLNTPAQSDTGKTIPLPDHNVVFENVSFGYDDHDILHDVNFTARQGTVTALVGPSGSGKSSIASLVPRFFDAGSGRVTIGGVDVRHMGLEQLMDTVAFVFQDTTLFTDTIANNIRFGKPGASAEEVENAARAARAHEFIVSLPDGYQTRLGDLGRKLSGGERQRIAIARAILKDSPIIILDEATAFADPDNEAAIQEAIEALAAGRTLIVVAHRLHTICEAECIVVVENGRIAEQGRHQDLIASQGLYSRLWADFTAARQANLRDGALMPTEA